MLNDETLHGVEVRADQVARRHDDVVTHRLCRENVPALVAEVRRLRARLSQHEPLAPTPAWTGAARDFYSFQGLGEIEWGPSASTTIYCSACGRQSVFAAGHLPVPWSCPCGLPRCVHVVEARGAAAPPP